MALSFMRPVGRFGLALLVVGSTVPFAFAEEHSSLANAFRQGWVQLGLSSGRIVLNGSRGVNYSTTSGPADRQEQLSIRMSGADPVVSYQRTTPEEDVAIDFTSADRLQIRRKPLGQSTVVAMEFRQSGSQPVVLKIGAGESQRVYQAPSLWHLTVLEPEACRTHLFPVLTVMHGEWDLAKLADEVEHLLLAGTARNVPSRERWAQWVVQLGDDRFSTREAADQRLREAGRVAITFLQQLDPQQLDTEQQYRIRRILLSYEDGGDDAPEDVAAWLSGDPAIWLAILTRGDEPTRRASAQRLEALLGRPIQFDPTADASVRAEQIKQVRTMLSAN